MKIKCLAFCIIAIALFIPRSAGAQVNMLLKATVTDEITGKPFSLNYEISGIGDKKKGRSNANNGTFEAVLKAGESYTIVFTGDDVLRTEEQFSVPPSEKYFEHTLPFKVKRLATGMELFRLHGYERGQTSLSSEATAKLTELKNVMNRNRSLRIAVIVMGDDGPEPPPPPPPPPAEPPKTKGKKSKKAIEAEKAAAEAAAKAAAEAAAAAAAAAATPKVDQMAINRGQALKEFFKDVRNADIRVKIIDNIMLKEGEHAGPDFINVTVKVDEVKSLFD